MEKKSPFEFHIDNWDSGFFKTRIARLKISGKKSYRFFSKEMSCAIKREKEKGMVFLLIRLEHPGKRLLNDLKNLRFKKCGEGVNLELVYPVRQPHSFCNGFSIGLCKPQEREQVFKITRDAYRLSYLYRSGFGKTKDVDRYHIVWAKNLLNDKRVRVFVARSKHKVLGYITLKMDLQARSASIVLIAVNKKARRSGIGSALLEKCVEYGRRHLDLITVRTQKNNERANALYAKKGFKLKYRDADFCRKIA